MIVLRSVFAFATIAALACESSSSEPADHVQCANFDMGPTVGPGAPGPTGFPELGCRPDEDGSNENSYYRCCSDDPAFVGPDNAMSSSGMCVHVEDIPPGSGVGPLNCPVACNPLASAADIELTCGPSRICCQTRELLPEDCVRDEATDRWRAPTPEEADDTLATERGYCMALAAGQSCPAEGIQDTCERIDAGEIDPPE